MAEHGVTNRGRLPGSKYTLTEVDVLDCATRQALERVVKKHRETSRGETGCCGCGKGGVLEEWKWVPKVPADVDKILKPKSTEGPPNHNYYDKNDEELTLLHYNRHQLIYDVYAADSPVFKDDAADGEVVEYIQGIPDEKLMRMEEPELRAELKRRGYSKPPYNVQIVLDSGSRQNISIQGEGSPKPIFRVAGQATTSEEDQADVLNVIVEALGPVDGERARKEFADGLPKVKKMRLSEARGLLKLLSVDPRFKNGQPVVQPSYYKRECHNSYCCLVFWLYWIGMLIVAYTAISTGDPYRLIQPIDYNGDTCGGDQQPSKTFMYYPQLASDARKIYEDSEYATTCSESTTGCFYGVCVESCPQKGDVVCNYETQVAIDTLCGSDASCGVKEKQKNVNNGCWIVQMKQREFTSIGRCFPWEDTDVDSTYTCETERVCEATQCTLDEGTDDETTLVFGDSYTEVNAIRTDNCPCSGPDLLSCTDEVDDQEECTEGVISLKLMYGCPEGAIKRVQVSTARYTEGTADMSAQFTSVSAWINQAFADIFNALTLIIVMGPVCGGVLAFSYILFMTQFAGTIIWLVLLSVQLMLILLTLAVAWQCGYLESVLTLFGINITIDTTDISFMETYAAFGDSSEESTTATITMWVIAFWIVFLMTIFYFCCLIGLRQQIRLATELIREAGNTVNKMKTMLLYPFFTYTMKSLMFVYFVVISTYIMTTEATADTVTTATSVSLIDTVAADMTLVSNLATESSSNDTVAFDTSTDETNTVVNWLFLYHLYGFYWVVEFISAIGMLTIAGCICSDYWITNDAFRPDSPLYSSFYRSIRYHAGSAIYGAAIVAMVRLWRAILMYVDKETKELQNNNTLACILMKVVHCCLYCLEKCARYITYAAYIDIAIEGRGFCAGAWRAFTLLFSNSLRFATTESISLMIIVLANVGITSACVMVTMLILNNSSTYTCAGLAEGEVCSNYVDNNLFPAIFVGISSFVVVSSFMQVYSMTITTLLLSFCLDEEKYKSGAYKEKLNERGDHDGRMFCVINNKQGLLSLVSSSIRKEQEDMTDELMLPHQP